MNLKDTTLSKPRRDSDSNQEGLRARAHDLQSSTPVTPTVVDDDDKWIWTPWDDRKHGPSPFIQRHSLRVDGIDADQVDLSVRALACRDSAHAEVNASATARLEALGEHSNLERHRTLRPRRLDRVPSPPPLRRKEYGSSPGSRDLRAHALLERCLDDDTRRRHELHLGERTAGTLPDSLRSPDLSVTDRVEVEFFDCSCKLREHSPPESCTLRPPPGGGSCTLRPESCTLPEFPVLWSVTRCSANIQLPPEAVEEMEMESPASSASYLPHISPVSPPLMQSSLPPPPCLPPQPSAPVLLPVPPVLTPPWPALSSPRPRPRRFRLRTLQPSDRPPELPPPTEPLSPRPQPLRYRLHPPPPDLPLALPPSAPPSPHSPAAKSLPQAASPVTLPHSPAPADYGTDSPPPRTRSMRYPASPIPMACLSSVPPSPGPEPDTLSLPPPRYAPGTVWWGSGDCGCGHCPSSIELWWQHADWCEQSLDHATARAAGRKADEMARSRGTSFRSILTSAAWPSLLYEERLRQEGTSVDALKAKLYAKYGNLRIQPAQPSECEHTSLHVPGASLLDSYVDLHGPLHCLPDDDLETGASQETEEVCLRYLDTLPLPGCGTRRSHRDCDHLWPTIPAPRHRRRAARIHRRRRRGERLRWQCGFAPRAEEDRVGVGRDCADLRCALQAYGEGPGHSRSGRAHFYIHS